MVFTHNGDADHFNPLSYGNLRGLEATSQSVSFTEMNSGDASSNSNLTGVGKENMFSNSEESNFGNADLKDDSPVSAGDFSFSWLSDSSYQSSAPDHGKRSFSDVKPCQISCKRPRQTEESTWLNSREEHPFSIAAEPSASGFTLCLPTTIIYAINNIVLEVPMGNCDYWFPALADGFVETREQEHIHAHGGTAIFGTSSSIHYPKGEHPIGEESLYGPDWITYFPGYFEDCVPAVGYNQADDIDSPLPEYVPRKGVMIGPDHQADVPEWSPRVPMDVHGSSSCADLAQTSVSTSEPAPMDEDRESDKWIRHIVFPMVSCSNPVALVGDCKTDCQCSDEGSIRCVRQHVMDAREGLRRILGHDQFQELGLCEMGEDISRRWTDEEEQLFQIVVFSNPVSLGKNFWDYLPHALPSKTSKELVSYYFNVFMLRKRAVQNRSDMLHVDSDDDESPGEPAEAEHESEDSVVESPIHVHNMHNFEHTEDVHEESEGEQFHGSSFPENTIDNDQTHLETNVTVVGDVDIQDESCTLFECQHNGAHDSNDAQYADC
uniref:Uncharacterized protein n=1 Tax=Avena sativa TaxID=4498 RepID=A0ACD5WYN8_AVESA